MVNPTRDRIIVRLPKLGEKVLDSGIVIPDSVNTKEKPHQGEVIAVGPGVTENGTFVPTTLEPGDQILFSKFSGIPLEVENEEVLILQEKDVLAVVA